MAFESYISRYGGSRKRGFTEMPDDGKAREALDNFGNRIGELDRYKQGGASRVERGVSAGRSAVANNVRRSGANAGSLAAMQIASDTQTGAFNQATANEAEFQRGIDNDVIGHLGNLSSLEMNRDNSLFSQGMQRDQFSFDRERYDTQRRDQRREERDDPNQALRDYLEQLLLNGRIGRIYSSNNSPPKVRGGSTF